jgi:hypothetical protein
MMSPMKPVSEQLKPLDNDLVELLREKTPAAPFRKASTTTSRSEVSANRMARVSGWWVRNWRIS